VSLRKTAARFGIDPTDGMATKHLKSYLGWRTRIERGGDNLTPRRSVACAPSMNRNIMNGQNLSD